MAGKYLYDGEWIKMRPLFEKAFDASWEVGCEVCGRVSCAPHWFSTKTKKLRCIACFCPKSVWPGK